MSRYKIINLNKVLVIVTTFSIIVPVLIDCIYHDILLTLSFIPITMLMSCLGIITYEVIIDYKGDMILESYNIRYIPLKYKLCRHKDIKIKLTGSGFIKQLPNKFLETSTYGIRCEYCDKKLSELNTRKIHSTK